MRGALALFLIASLTHSQEFFEFDSNTNATDFDSLSFDTDVNNTELVTCHNEIFCNDQKHVLSKQDCDRGMVWQYCAKTLTKMPDELEFSTKEVMSKFSYAFQSENGMIFYIDTGNVNWTLYVKCDGKKIEATLPDGFQFSELMNSGIHANAFYFQTKGKIYNATFTPPDLLNITFIRKQLQTENFFRYGMCSLELDGFRYHYRVWDDPDRDKIIGAENSTESDGVVGANIHRRKLIFIKQNKDRIGTIVERWSPNRFAVYIPFFSEYLDLVSRASSPFFYIINKDSVITINTDTMEILPPLAISSVRFLFIVGVHNGELTLMDQDRFWHLISARLPSRYVDPLFQESGEVCLSPSLRDWNTTLPWQLILSSAPILGQSCLDIESSRLTIICDSAFCNDTLLVKWVSDCASRHSRGLMQYVERSKIFWSDPSLCDCSSSFLTLLSDVNFLVRLFIFVVLSLQTLNTYRNTAKIEKLRHQLHKQADIPLLPQEQFVESRYQ